MKFSLKPKKIKLSSIEDIFTLIAAGTILFIMLLSVSNVIGRYLFNWPVPGAIEIAEMLLVIIVFLSISGVQRSEDHIGMDTFLELLRRKQKGHYHRLQAFHGAVFFLMMGIIGYYFFPNMLESLKFHEWTEGPLYLPKWPFKLCIVIGCVLICVRLILQTIQHSKASLGHHQEKESGTQED